MEKHTLQTLIHCYQHSPSLVLIMDMDWQIIWTNREHHHIQYLPQQLGISPDHKEHTTHQFIYDGQMQECRLLCNSQEGCRIAEIFPRSHTELVSLRMDVDAITASVQSMTSACHALYNELNALELYDQTPLLNIMIGSCYRIYRMAYLQKELDRLQHGERRKDLFSVNTAMLTLYQKCRDILRACVQVEMEPCNETVFLAGDLDEFVMAALSAVTLCCKDCNYFQSLHFRLSLEDGMACLQLHAEQEAAELPDTIRQTTDISAGSCEGERMILTLFTQQHSGRWILAEQPEKKSKSCSIYFQPASQNTGNLILHSSRDVQEGRFYNKYETMLSCIHYRRMF